MRLACLFVIPVVVVALLFWLRAVRGPFWLALNQDPSYHYLLNSLLVAEGHAPYHFDNPGTPLQVLGALVLHVTHWFRAGDALRADVLQNPEAYLRALHAVLSCLYGVVLAVVGVAALRITRRLPIALLMQASPLLAIRNLVSVARVMPESLIVSFVALFCLVVLAYVWRRSGAEAHAGDTAVLVLLGVLIGLTTATKLTSLPLAVAPLVLLRGVRARLLYVGTSIAAFVVATLPTLPNYPKIVAWYIRWGTHTGAYGTGEQGAFDSGQVSRLYDLLVEQPVLPLVFVLLAAGVVWLWRRGRTSELPPQLRRTGRAMLALLVAMGVQLVMLLKQPRPHYLIPTLACLGLGAALLFELCTSWSLRWRAVAAAAGVALLVLVGSSQVTEAIRWRTAFPRTTARFVGVEERVAHDYPQAAKVYFYRASAPAYALLVSSGRSGHYYGEDLRALYPNCYVWSFWRKRYLHFGRRVSLDEIAAGRTDVVFQGTPLSRPPSQGVPVTPPGGAVIEIVSPGPPEAIYKLKEILPDPQAPGEVVEPATPAD